MNELMQFFGASVSIIATIIGAAAFLYKEIKESRKEAREGTREAKEEAAEIRKELQRQAERTEKDIQLQRERMEEESKLQTQRSDKLYEMFIDLLKNPPPPKSSP